MIEQTALRCALFVTASLAPILAFAQDGVADIVVTAQKREQNLQDVPVSITALSSDTIQSNRIRQVTDISAIAPNLTVRASAGGSNIPQYSLRGTYTFGSAVGTDKGVALYIDGVYVQASAASIFEFADVDRIEVLKGPQGTLFGRNSTGGAVSILTRDPSGEFGVRQELSYGNYDQFRTRTRVDLPALGSFKASVSYMHSERDGDMRNLGAGTVWDYGPATGSRIGKLASPKRLGDQNVEALFVAIKGEISPDLTLSYKYDYSENDFTPEGTGLSYLNPTYPAALGASYVNAALATPVSTRRPDAVNNWFTTPSRSTAQGHNLTANWEISSAVSAKNILAYRKTSIRSTFQLDALGGLVNTATQLPFLLTANNAQSHDSQFSNELQFNINTDLVTLTLGGIYFHYDQETQGIPNTFNVLQGVVVAGQNTTSSGAFVIPANNGFIPSRVKVDSTAAFGQAEFHVTDTVDLVGGVRVTHDRKKGYESIGGTIAAPSNGRTSPVNYKDTRLTWLAGINYKPSRDLLVYAKYSTGYISGGQLATIAFEPETAKSWEAGVKAELFDRRLRSNLAVFHVDYANIQQAILGSLTGVPAAATFSNAIVPSADATAKGFEWENTFVPVTGMTLGANVGYTDFDYKADSVFPGFVFTTGAPGIQVFQRPKWSGNFNVQMKPQGLLDFAQLAFRLDANFKSKTLLWSDITPGNGPTAQVDPAYLKGMQAPFQWIVNGRIALENFSIGGGSAELALWGRNLFDNREMVQATGFGVSIPVLYERARTYGIDLNFTF